MARKPNSKTLLSVAIEDRDPLIPEEDTICLTASADDDTERHSILELAVEQVFPPGRDRVIYEADDPADRHRAESTGHMIRPAGSGMSAALGLLGARHRLDQDHRVVLVASACSTDSILQQLDLRGIDGLAGCVIVVPTSSGQRTAHSDVLRRFESRGGGVLDLSAIRTLRELTAGFEETARRRAVCLVLIDPAMTPFWQRKSGPPSNGTRPSSQESVAERVLLSSVSMEIARYTRDDPRATPVLFQSGRPWRKLVEEFDSRVLSPGDLDIDESLAWCAALAQGGCHPIVVMNSGQMAEHREALRAHLFSHDRRATVVVLDPESGSLSLGESVLTPVLTDVSVVVPGTPDEVAPLTRAVLRADGPRLLYIPGASFCAERDRWLDFRAAANLRERAGREPMSTALPLMVGAVQRESREMEHRQLTQEVHEWVREYDEIVGRHGCDSWRRVSHAIQLLELPSVDPEWRRRNRDTKFLAAMVHVLLEDAAGGTEGGGRNLAQQLMRRPGAGQAGAFAVPHGSEHARFTARVWDELWRRAAGTPRFGEFMEVLRYDFRQLCNTIDYTDLVLRQPEMINSVEHAMYSPHGMMVTCNATLDLMCSTRFDANQLGPLREALWHAACMARYGDLLTSGRHEFGTGQTNGRVGGRSLRSGRLRPVEAAPEGNSKEREYLNRWQIHRACVLSLRERVSSCSLRSYVEGLDRLLASACAAGPGPADRRAAAIDG